MLPSRTSAYHEDKRTWFAPEEEQPSTLADRSAALYRPCSYFRVGIADVSRKSEADVRPLRARHAARAASPQWSAQGRTPITQGNSEIKANGTPQCPSIVVVAYSRKPPKAGETHVGPFFA
jgi:hypothetical protein